MSFRDTKMSFVHVDLRDVRPSIFACVHSRGYSFDPIYLKLCQNFYVYEIWVKFETELYWVKN